jgi:glycosyltransferase involved in cell wall biosynthesis
MLLPANMSAGRDLARGVLIIVENMPVPVDRRVWQEATALHQAGYTVSVICPKGKGYDKAYEQIDGVHIYRHRLPVEGSGAISYLFEYTTALFWELILSLKVARRHGFDIVHGCNPPDLIFLVAIFHKFFFGKKFLFDQHDLVPELYEVKFGRKDFFYRLLLLFERWTFRWADGSLATNATLKELAVARGGMPSDRVWVVRSVPDLERFRPVKPDPSIRRAFRYLVGYVGIIAEQDGVDLLVEAMDHIVKNLRRPDVACLIIGDGPQVSRLKALADERGIAENVEFAGYISGDALLAKLGACDIGVVPDPPNACNGKMSMIKVFEYMALGLPFVQFDLIQAKSDAGAAALVVANSTPQALGDGIVSLLENGAARERMRNYGRERAHREFQWEAEKRSLLAAYATLAPKRDDDESESACEYAREAGTNAGPRAGSQKGSALSLGPIRRSTAITDRR